VAIRDDQPADPAPAAAARPRRAEGLEIISEVEDGFVVYQQARGRAHYLNPAAILILELCNGRNTPHEIADLVRTAYRLPAPPVREVSTLLTRLEDEGLTVAA
jgi:hypothetical protein